MGSLYKTLEGSPVIAAVKEEAALTAALSSSCEVVFLLSGNICTISEKVGLIHSAGKQVYIHIDLMDGFGHDKYAIRYIRDQLAPDGIISTRSHLIKTARELEIPAIQRIFLIDNLSIDTGIQSIKQVKPDAVEIMPGKMPSVTRYICSALSVPVIAGGLIAEKEDIIASLSAGAIGVSTSSQALWDS